MKLRFASVGRPDNRALDEVAAMYRQRLTRYARVDEVVVAKSRHREAALARREESRALSEGHATWTRIVMDERGTCVPSTALAQRLERFFLAGRSDLVFLVGGANGHDESMRQDADWIWSLSPLTLPHELARVVLFEQIYRAFTILRNEPYHKDG